jgi:hypothetical protein
VVIAYDSSGKPDVGAYVSIWATADSLLAMERLIADAVKEHPEWAVGDVYTIDRVAFDERPEELADLKPSDRRSRVHLITFDRWNEPPPPGRPPEASRHQRD